MVTEVISSVIADGTGDYTTLSAWESAKRGNLVVADTIQIAEIYGSASGSVGSVVLSAANWTTNATHYPVIRAASGHSCSGIFDATKAYIAGGFGTPVINTAVPFTRIGPGISILCHQFVEGAIKVTTGPCIIDGIVLKSSVSSTSWAIYLLTLADGTIIRNTVIQPGSSTTFLYGVNIYANAGSQAGVLIHNNTIRANGAGSACIRIGSYPSSGLTVVTSKNNYLSNVTGSCYVNRTDWPAIWSHRTHDATSNTEAITSDLRNIAYTADNFTSVVQGSEDYHIKSSGILYGGGDPITGFVYDVEDKVRPEYPSIGAFDGPVASGVVKTINPDGTGDYLNLVAWASGRCGNLKTRNTCEIAEFTGNNTHESGVTLLSSEWTVDPNHYAWIRAASGYDHAGIFSTKRSLVQLKQPIDVRVGYTKIGPGFCVHSNTDYVNPDQIVIRDIYKDQPCVVDRVILHRYNGTAVRIENCSGVTGHCVKNCSIHCRSTSNGVKTVGAGSRAFVYNNTFNLRTGGNNGVWSSTVGSIITTQNNYFGGIGETDVCYYTYASPSTNGTIVKGTHDITWNTEASGADKRNIACDTSNFYYPNPGGWGWHEGQFGIEDMHIKPGSPLIGAGTPLSGTSPASFRPLYGIDNQLRTSSWDVGADEYTTPTIVEKTVGAVGCDYPTISGWILARGGNLATKDTVEIAQIQGTVSGFLLGEKWWGTNSKNYIQITAASGQSHSGLFVLDKALIKNPPTAPNNTPVIVCNIGGVYIGPGLCIDCSYRSTAGTLEGIRVGGQSPAPVVIDRNILYNYAGTNGCYLINVNAINYSKSPTLTYPGVPTKIQNCLLCSLKAGAYGIYSQGGLVQIHNCTVVMATTFGVTAFRSISPQGTYSSEDNNYFRGWASYDINFTKGAHSATADTGALTSALRNVYMDGSNFRSLRNGSENFEIMPLSILNKNGVRYTGCEYDLRGYLRPICPSIGAYDYPIGSGVTGDIAFALV